MIDQIFDQLDEENNGHISPIKLLGIIKSLEDSTSSELMDLKDLRSEVAETFSSSPPLCPEYEDQDNIQLVLSNLNTNLFSTLDPQNTGWVSNSVNIDKVSRVKYSHRFPSYHPPTISNSSVPIETTKTLYCTRSVI